MEQRIENRKPIRSVVEVHGNQVYQTDYFSETDRTPYRIVGSCTSEEAARAVARLLSL